MLVLLSRITAQQIPICDHNHGLDWQGLKYEDYADCDHDKQHNHL